MESRNYNIRSLSWLSCLLLLVVIILLNASFSRARARVDLTEEGIYTLSDGSRKILHQLEDPAIVKVFWHNVPLQFDHTKRYVQALLEEMQAESGDGFQVQWVDMDEDEGQTMASELGVEEWVFHAKHGSEMRESRGHMSLTIELGNEGPAVLNALSTIEEQLEYLIVATIYQRTRSDPPVIGFTAKKPPFNPFAGGAQRSPYSDFEETLQKAFGNAARTYLTLDEHVPEDVTVLIVAGPRDLTEEQAYRLEQFMLRGGRVVLLLDPVSVDTVFSRGGPMGGGGQPHTSGLEDWLEHLGVTAESGVVGDFGAPCRAPLQEGLVHYVYWPRVMPENLDQENPVTRNLAPMPLYWPAALSVDQKKQEAEGRTATVLGTTTSEGYRRGDITGLARAMESPEGKVLEKVPLLVLIEGPMKSFWLGKPVPGTKPPEEEGDDDDDGDEPKSDDGQPKDGDEAGSDDGDDHDAPKSIDGEPKDGDEAGSDDGDDDDAPKSDDGEPKDGDEAKPDDEPEPADEAERAADDEPKAEEEGPERLEDGSIRLMIVGDAEMISDQFGPYRSRLRGINLLNGVTGFSFVVNAADWMSGSDDLLALRARATNPRNLEEIEDDDRDLLKSVNLLLVPLLVLLAGITVFFVRRS